MAKGKARTDEEKKRDRDKRYQQKYRITLDTYNKIGEAQGWCCGACGRHASEFTVSLNVDHEHFKIEMVRGSNDALGKPNGWIASTTIRNFFIARWGSTKAKARKNLQDVALPLSVRGLLCPGRYTGCNRLMGRVDRIDWLKKVLVYLENPPAHSIIS